MKNLVHTPQFTMLQKPFLNVHGLEYFGRAVYNRAEAPLVMHSHDECLEITFLIEGRQSYFIENTNYPLIGGQAFIAFPNQPHSSGGSCQDVGKIYWMGLKLTDKKNFLGFNPKLSNEITDKLANLNQHVFSFDSKIKEMLMRVFEEFYQNGASVMALSSMMYLVTQVLENVENNRMQEDRFAILEKYIDMNIFEDIRVDELSRICNVSVSTIQHKFKEHFGITPAKYISYKKIQKSKELLLSGKSVTETAMCLGFSSSDYFSTVFRKFTSTSPSQWIDMK